MEDGFDVSLFTDQSDKVPYVGAVSSIVWSVRVKARVSGSVSLGGHLSLLVRKEGSFQGLTGDVI